MAIPHSPTSRQSTPTPTRQTTKSLPYRHVPARSNNSSTAAGLAGTKRSKPGTPAHRQLPSHSSRESSGAHSYITPASSDDELEDSDSDESDVESCCGDQSDANNVVLPEDHMFQQAVQPLLNYSLKRVREFIDIAQYTAPPDKQEPPRKRSRPSDWQQPEPTTPSQQESSDDEFVVVSPPRGNFHFSCPFYASNPQKHQQCLKKHDLVTPENVIRHVQRHHLRRPYCPICSRVFDSTSQCDSHIIKRQCELRDLVLPEGINYYQKARLVRDDKPNFSNKRRWERINATVFPNEESVSSPYLSKGLGLEVSMARDYWREHGRTIVLGFLKKQGMLREAGQDDEEAQAALYKLTLEKLVSKIVDEYDSV
ncbi:hypothetical protein CEP54_010909 [Fusarium duplospermum]|uniref:C2H2-type domain-containing protein n=1 Tax=Fusarium duplospermum TaxID=1325734 RepID=A0A428PHC0_9HYPO|nr:hypothetical protein CEP54_010909 [Fusarium duplospermum]